MPTHLVAHVWLQLSARTSCIDADSQRHFIPHGIYKMRGSLSVLLQCSHFPCDISHGADTLKGERVKCSQYETKRGFQVLERNFFFCTLQCLIFSILSLYHNLLLYFTPAKTSFSNSNKKPYRIFKPRLYMCVYNTHTHTWICPTLPHVNPQSRVTRPNNSSVVAGTVFGNWVFIGSS